MNSIHAHGLPLTVPELLNKALHQLVLDNPAAPVISPRVVVNTVTLEDGEEQTYLVVSPEMTGLTSDELMALFEEDQAQPGDDTELEHPYLDELHEQGLEDLRMHQEDLDISTAFVPEEGLLPEGALSTYGIVVVDQDRQVLGAAEFVVSIEPLLNPDEAAGVSLLSPFSPSPATLVLDVALQGIYVRKAYRGLSVGSTLIHAIGRYVQEELKALAEKLFDLYSLVETPFDVQTQLYCDWDSKAGKLMSELLLDELQLAVDTLSSDWRECPALEALDLADVELVAE